MPPPGGVEENTALPAAPRLRRVEITAAAQVSWIRAPAAGRIAATVPWHAGN